MSKISPELITKDAFFPTSRLPIRLSILRIFAALRLMLANASSFDKP